VRESVSQIRVHLEIRVYAFAVAEGSRDVPTC
jgi:hypothetical protein